MWIIVDVVHVLMCTFFPFIDAVYAAYGDYILVLNATSDEILAKVQMPPIEEPTKEVVDVSAGEPVEATTEKDLGGGRRRESSIYPV